MKSGLVELSILFLGLCVVATSLPEYREMDRKDEYLRGCMESHPENREIWLQIGMCERAWIGRTQS